MMNIIATLLAISLSLVSLTVCASANKPKPGQKSTTCYFNLGPKVGQEVSLKGQAQPVPIGKFCSDGEGNSGIAVFDKEDKEAEEAEEIAKDALKAGKMQHDSSIQLSSTCKFNEGPRTGEVENYHGKTLPIPVGSPCSDGVRSIGVAIPE